MLRKSLLTLALLFSAVAAFSQNNYYYVRYDGATDAAYNINTIITDGAVVLQSGSNDVLSASQSIPFAWTFYGQAVTSYKVSDNGYITFDQSASTSEYYNDGMHLPTDMAPTNSIFALWDNLQLVPLSDQASVKTDVRSYTYGTAPNRVHVIQWLAASPKGTNPSSTANWDYFAIRLYEAGGFDIIYGGDAIKATVTATIGAQNADGSVGVELPGSPNLSSPKLTNGYAIYKFTYGSQPAKDVEGLSLNMYDYVSQATGSSISMTIHNLGSETINNVEMSYSVDNGAPVSRTINGLNIAGSGGYATITFPDTWMPTSHGSAVSLKAWVSKINGGDDENTSNDAVTKSIYVSDHLTQRKVLVEEFTQASCPPCAAQNPFLEQVLDDNMSSLAAIKYHTSWPGVDPMNAANPGDVNTRVQFYGINAVPWSFVDGLMPVGVKYYTGAPGDITDGIIKSEYARPGTFEIKPTITLQSDGTYKFDMDYTSLVNSKGALKVYAAVVEDVNYDQEPGTNGETSFPQTLRRMFPNAAGTSIGTVTEGQTKSLSFTYKPDDKVNVYFTRFITWVQDPTTHEVHNAYWSSPELTTSIQQPKNSIITSVYPNPVSNVTNLQFNLDKSSMVSATLMDMTGRTVKTILNGSQMAAGAQNVQIDVTSLQAGVYILNLDANGQRYTQKLVVE